VIRAVLVDFAGTMTEDVRPVFLQLAEASGADPAELAEMVTGGGQASDHPWCRFERGEITMAEVVEWGRVEGAARGWTLDFTPLIYGVISIPVRSGMVDRLRGLRACGYRTALVTNNVKELATLWPTMFPVNELFDVVTDSSAVGTRKPEPEIFDITLERLDAEAHEAILFDDIEVNVAAAREYGMDAVLMEADPVAAYAVLDRLLAVGAADREKPRP
jgi:putative hydrolase of the HAD superfamily